MPAKASPLTPAAMRDAVIQRCVPEPNTGCWLWTAGANHYGYGRFRNGRKVMVAAHRASYEGFVGPIPAGLQIDHKCRVRCCVNPDHLEAVTMAENIRRGVSPSAVNRVATHCRKGHPLFGENLRLDAKSGKRNCRECHRGWQLDYLARREFIGVNRDYRPGSGTTH